MKYIGIAIGVVVFAHAVLIAAAAVSSQKRKMKIGLVTASFPWLFGPYQSQMYALSLLLNEKNDDDEIEYDIYWVHYSSPEIPRGVYNSHRDFQHYIPTSNPPPPDMKLDHLKFLGSIIPQQIVAQNFNELQEVYGLDCLITLMDITKTVPNAVLNLPVLAWIPLHSETVSTATPDYWVLRQYHGIAGLAPSSATAMNDAVGKEIDLSLVTNDRIRKKLTNTYGTTQVDFIPHIFNRKKMNLMAEIGLMELESKSVAEADAALNKKAIINRGQESTLEPDHPKSLFGKNRINDNFVVLMQGGNYEAEDRKGWDSSLQAFARFYNSLDDPSGVHLLIHSMESYLISGDNHLDQDAPGGVMPIGVSLAFMLHEHGIPKEAYTLDIAKHAPEVVAAYKKRADVCLHPSKVEGFGMNVMECQIIGTPVITTNYTAMGDYTKIGRSVSHRQKIRIPGGIYDMAVPDVIGVADALGELYEEHQAMLKGDKSALARREAEVSRFNEWIDNTCSPAAVGDKFKALLIRTFAEFDNRKAAKQSVLSATPPTSGAFQIATGYHNTIVDWDTPWTLLAPDGMRIVNPDNLNMAAWMHLFSDGAIPNVLVVPATYEDGTMVPYMNNDGSPNEDLPLLVRTYMITAFQGRMSRRKSIAFSAVNTAGQPLSLKPGMVIIDRNMKQSSA